ITVPTEASGRRVTFHSGPISFLKAVRAIAGLGGCDMTVDEATLALILHRETYPQVPNRKDIRSLLASQVNADGTTAAEDPKRVAALIADAASLGIAVDVKQPLEDQAVLPMTRGQWQALQALTEARQQLSQFPAPSFQLYFTNDRLGGERVLDEDEASQMQLQLQRDAGVQSVVAKPLLKTAVEFGDQIMVAGLTFQPLGEATQVTLAIPSAVLASNRTNSNSGGSNVNGEYTGGELVTAVLRGGQGATFNINSSSALTLPGSSLNFAVGATEISVSSSLSHLVIISGPPPTQSPPPPP
ncbi:MAG TPA: hypothetical protein VD994_03475, partial [Prosthecobacter sp.]|nr:hypothetical protein [Prosthecobacter sp.]